MSAIRSEFWRTRKNFPTNIPEFKVVRFTNCGNAGVQPELRGLHPLPISAPSHPPHFETNRPSVMCINFCAIKTMRIIQRKRPAIRD